jgi:hypothetical protein
LWLDDRGVGVRIPVSSITYIAQDGPRVHLTANPMGIRADHSSATNGKVKKTWSFISIPPYVFMM